MGKLFAIALFGAIVPAAAPAQSDGPIDPFMELAAQFTEPEVVSVQVEAMMTAMRSEFAADPDIADLEAECPGAIDKSMDVLWDLYSRDQDEEIASYRVELAEFFRANMPGDQAGEAAEFYKSELGKKVLRAVGKNRTFSNMARSMVQSEDGGVGMDALAADMAETNAAVQDDLQAELFAASIDLGSREWVATLGRLRPQLQEFSLQHLNAELSPEEDAEAEARITEALTGHIDACYE